MDTRKMRILQAVTDDYILTAEPVGSRTLARKYGLGVSPATIRNEMADLEELGYLEQPHASAGRIPSDLGYRYYVDGLMSPAALDEAERRAVAAELAGRAALEELARSTSHVVASLTRYASVAVMPSIDDAVLRRVELVPLEPRAVLVILVALPGMVEHRMVETRRAWTVQELARVAGLLNERLEGVTLRDVGRTVLQQMADALNDPDLFEGAASLLQQALADTGDERVYLEGVVNLVHQPEFRDVQRLRPLLEFLEQREELLSTLSGGTKGGLVIRIGQENGPGPLQGCSLVTATYEVDGRVVGEIGVLGPTRMDYGRVVAVVSLVAEELSQTLAEQGRRGRT
ncbi:heat-inducible transcriptional repressor HrcA [Limnochorda pilosa]|uniref:Heat-inducible transcription repressor HrcA n=1 Tax=Limnochorda pilosa TaxID=1555112 RepID=A0A0K2SMY2_LIMPI|nr:heat-inducible transcriptional repressor HrcA [Limnochorda pilosa]BAS28493.1 HrcA family transcriptional regulator [Limnochorda pilosa]